MQAHHEILSKDKFTLIYTGFHKNHRAIGHACIVTPKRCHSALAWNFSNAHRFSKFSARPGSGFVVKSSLKTALHLNRVAIPYTTIGNTWQARVSLAAENCQFLHHLYMTALENRTIVGIYGNVQRIPYLKHRQCTCMTFYRLYHIIWHFLQTECRPMWFSSTNCSK